MLDLGCVYCQRQQKEKYNNMTKEDKENLENKRLTDSIVISCLSTCESVISKNAYLEKKWSNYAYCYGQTAGDDYRAKRLEWMGYREKLRSLLLPKYHMQKIIQMTKSCTDRATLKAVKEVIDLIDKKDYVLV